MTWRLEDEIFNQDIFLQFAESAWYNEGLQHLHLSSFSEHPNVERIDNIEIK